MKKKLIISAISGGVDSSVATAIYLEKGYEVIGVTLRLNKKFQDLEPEREYSLEEERAVSVCKKLGIEHRFLDCVDMFQDLVLKYSFDEYKKGRTPNPCAYCNKNLKFELMLKVADELGAEGVITGHYTNKFVDANGNQFIKRGSDTQKDQSYFLSMLGANQLSRVFFPLAELDKSEVRAKAEELGLVTAKAKESQDVCFINKGENFQEKLAKTFNYTESKGKIVDESGKVLGEHIGIFKYTIGQRKGLNVAMGKPAFVSCIDSCKNEVVLSTEQSSLMSSLLTTGEFNWYNNDFNIDPEKVYKVQVRYRQKPVDAKIQKNYDMTVTIKFNEPQRAVCLGQVAAVYDDDLLLGGGWIEHVE